MLKNNPDVLRAWQQRSRDRQRDNPKPRAKIRAVSKKHAAALKEYAARRLIHLEANPHCARCEADGETTPATDIHHIKGRDGERLIESENFLALCRYCHEAVHDNPAEAKALGWSQSRHQRRGE